MRGSDAEREAVPVAGGARKSAGVGCMVARPEAALRSATRTPSGTAITPQKQLLAGANWPN